MTKQRYNFLAEDVHVHKRYMFVEKVVMQIKRMELKKWDDFKPHFEVVFYEYNADFTDIQFAPFIFKETEATSPYRNMLKDKNIPIKSKGIEKFEKYIFILGKLSRTAEIISQEVENLLYRYLKDNDLEEICNRNPKCKKVDNTKAIEFRSFYELSRLLSCVVKTDPRINSISMLGDEIKKNYFTSTLNNYITDRNHYTHGYLLFEGEELMPLLRIKEDGELYGGYLTEDIIKSNIDTAIYLDTMLHHISIKISSH